MWAYCVEGPARLARVEVPAPQADDLAPGEVILRLLAAGICGSDIPRWQGKIKPHEGGVGFPLHELCGEIVASRHPDLRPGQRVVGMAKGSRGFSEYVRNPGDYLRPVEVDLPSSTVTVIQPVATVINALDRVPPAAGRPVAVIGQGPLGILFSQVLKARGASRVTGVDRVERTDVAADFGVDDAVWSSSEVWARNLADADRPDLCIEAVGHQHGTLNDAIEACAPNGHIFAFGVPDDSHYALAFERLFRRGLTLAAAVTADYQRFLAEAQRHVEDHPVLRERYITDRVGIADAQGAFELYSRPAKGRLKVVLTVDDD
jgi:L-iditol 2-dehydrogenase